MEKDNISKIELICDKVLEWGLYALAFLLPIFFLPFNASVLELSKQLLLVFFSLVFLIAWLGKIIVTGRLEFRKSKFNLIIILFLIFYLASALLSKNIYLGLIGGVGTVAESFLSLVALVIVFFAAVNGIKDSRQSLGLFFALTLSGIFLGISTILQMAGKVALPWSFAAVPGFNFLGSLNALEIFLAGLLVWGLVVFVSEKALLWQKIFYGFSSTFFLVIILITNYANVWWGLVPAMIFILGLGIINRDRISFFRLILPIAVLTVSVLVLLTNLNVFSSWFSVPAEASPSLRASLSINKEVLKNNLFFGTGPGSFSYDYGIYRSADLNYTDFWNIRFNQAYSKNLTLPSTLGAAGALVWLLLVIGFAIFGLVKIFKKRGANWILALGSFTGWLFFASLQFFYSTNLVLEFSFWLTMAVAFLAIKSLGDDEIQEEFSSIEASQVEFNKTSPLASVLSFIFVVIIVLSISVFYMGATYYYADILYQKGLNLVNEKNDVESGSIIISKAVLLNPYNDLYLRNLAQVALARVNQEFQKPQDATRDAAIQNLIATAINIAKRSTDLAPLNVENWLQRASIYRSVMAYTSGADQWAVDSYREAVKLEPNNPYYYYELGRAYALAAELLTSSSGDKAQKRLEYLNKAEEAFNQSVILKRDYAPSLYQLAIVSEVLGKTDQAIEKMEETQSLYPNDVGLAFQLGLLYYKKNNFNESQAQFEKAVVLDNNYSNARYFLGLIYDRKGNKQAAIEQFEKIVELNPDSQEVKDILTNLRAGKPALGNALPDEVPLE